MAKEWRCRIQPRHESRIQPRHEISKSAQHPLHDQCGSHWWYEDDSQVKRDGDCNVDDNDGRRWRRILVWLSCDRFLQLRLRSCKLEHVDWCRKLRLMNWSRRNSRGTKLKPQKHHKHPSSLEHDPIRLHVGSLWWQSSMGLLHAANSKKTADTSKGTKLIYLRSPNCHFFLTFWFFFSVKECAWWCIITKLWLIMNNYDIKFERLGVQSGTISSQSAVLLY